MPWPKGKKHSQQTIKKLRVAQKTKIGPKNQNWKGGRVVDTEGYIIVRAPDHPSAMLNGYVREHRLVMEAHLGRYLRRSEIVHHKNGDQTDNRLENLDMMSQGAHVCLHHVGTKRSAETRARISVAMTGKRR